MFIIRKNIKSKVEILFLRLYVLGGPRRWTEIETGIVHHQCQQTLNQTKGFVPTQHIKHEDLQYEKQKREKWS